MTTIARIHRVIGTKGIFEVRFASLLMFLLLPCVAYADELKCGNQSIVSSIKNDAKTALDHVLPTLDDAKRDALLGGGGYTIGLENYFRKDQQSESVLDCEATVVIQPEKADKFETTINYQLSSHYDRRWKCLLQISFALVLRYATSCLQSFVPGGYLRVQIH